MDNKTEKRIDEHFKSVHERFDKAENDAELRHRDVKRDLAKIRHQLNAISEKLDNLGKQFIDMESNVLERLDGLDDKVEKITDAVDNVKDYLKQSDIEIKVTASDFEGALKSISVGYDKSARGRRQYQMHDMDSALPVEYFVASNVYRLSENDGEFLQEGPVKKLFQNLKPGHIVNVDRIASAVKNMGERDRKGLKEARDISIRQITEQVALRMKRKMSIDADGSGEPLDADAIEDIYLSEVEALSRDGWQSDAPRQGVLGTPEKIAQNALVLLNENREYFMKYNKGHFESQIDSIHRAFKSDERAAVKGNGKFLRLMNELRSGSQAELEYDPNSMNSVFTAKNMAYLLRASGANLVHQRSKKAFGDDVAKELKVMAKEMKTREGMLTAMKQYILDNADQPGAPPKWMMRDVNSYYKDLKGHFNSKSYEAKFIVKRAFDIAIAKKEPDFHRHLGAADVSEKDKEIADMVIAGACVFDCKEALEYVDGNRDPKRQGVRESCIRTMEENGSMNQLMKHIAKELPQNGRSYSLSHMGMMNS